MSANPQKLSPQSFAAKIREKYPDAYNDVDDNILTRRILSKYPDYRDMVDLPDLDQPIDPSTIEKEALNFGLQISSGKRTPERNRAVGGAENSYHLSDQARDFTGNPEQMKNFYNHVRDTYGGRFAEILDEKDHIHLAWDKPKITKQVNDITGNITTLGDAVTEDEKPIILKPKEPSKYESEKQLLKTRNAKRVTVDAQDLIDKWSKDELSSEDFIKEVTKRVYINSLKFTPEQYEQGLKEGRINPLGWRGKENIDSIINSGIGQQGDFSALITPEQFQSAIDYRQESLPTKERLIRKIESNVAPLASGAMQGFASLTQLASNLGSLLQGKSPEESDLAKKLVTQAQEFAERGDQGAYDTVASALMNMGIQLPVYSVVTAVPGGVVAESAALGGLGALQESHRGKEEALKAGLMNAALMPIERVLGGASLPARVAGGAGANALGAYALTGDPEQAIIQGGLGGAFGIPGNSGKLKPREKSELKPKASEAKSSKINLLEAREPNPTIIKAHERTREVERRLNIAERERDVDPLTNVANRRALDKALPSAESDPNISVIAFDANNFGQINKVVSHEAGDQMLKRLSLALMEATEDFPNARVFRRGGDEFVILAPKEIAEQVRSKAEQIFGEHQIPNSDKKISLSGTVANTFDEADSILQSRKAERKGLEQEPKLKPIAGRTPEQELDAFKQSEIEAEKIAQVKRKEFLENEELEKFKKAETEAEEIAQRMRQEQGINSETRNPKPSELKELREKGKYLPNTKTTIPDFTKFDGPEDVQQALIDTAYKLAEEGKLKKFTRGEVSTKVTEANAEKLGFGAKDLEAIRRRFRGNDAVIYRMSGMLSESVNKIKEIGNEAKINPTPENLARLAQAEAEHELIASTFFGVRAETGRALRVYNTIQKALAYNSDKIKVAADIAKVVDGEAPKLVRKIEFDGSANKIFTQERATAAQARIREKWKAMASGSQFNMSLPVDLIADYLEYGGFLVEGGVRSFSKWAKQMKADLGNVADEDLKELWQKVKTEAQKRAVTPATDREKMIEKALKEFEGEKAKRVIDEIDKIDENDPKALFKYNKILRNNTKFSVGDKLGWYQRANLMSGPPGAARDVISTGLWQTMDNLIFRPTRALVERGTAKIQGRKSELYVSETVPAIKGWIQGIGPGLKEAFDVIRYGYGYETAKRYDLPTFYEGPGGALNPLNQVLRIRGALNEIQRNMGMGAELHAEAFRITKQEGLKGEAAKTRYNELIQNPTEDMIEKATKYSEYSTFTDEPDKLLESFYKIRDLEIPRTGVRPGQFVFPFVRTTYNLMKRGLELTPLGTAKLLKKGMSNTERADTLAKAALGSTFMTYLALNADLAGSAPSNSSDRKDFYASGKQEWSIKIGEHWIPFKDLGPIGIPAAITAAFKDKYRNKKSEQFESDLLKAATASGKHIFVDQTALRTAGEWYDALTGDYKSKGLQEIIGKQSQGFVPFSQTLRVTAESQDDYLRNPQVWYQWIQQGLPGERPKVPLHETPIENRKKGLKALSPIVSTKEVSLDESKKKELTSEQKAIKLKEKREKHEKKKFEKGTASANP